MFSKKRYNSMKYKGLAAISILVIVCLVLSCSFGDGILLPTNYTVPGAISAETVEEFYGIWRLTYLISDNDAFTLERNFLRDFSLICLTRSFVRFNFFPISSSVSSSSPVSPK